MDDNKLEVCREKERWDAFVNASPQGNVFCSTAFLDALPTEYDLLTSKENGEIILGAVVLRSGEEGLKAPYPMTMYQGILCTNKYQDMPLHKRPKWLLERLTMLITGMEARYNRISFCLSHTFDDLRPFQWFHYHEPRQEMFTIDLRYTGILDLKEIADFETYLATIRTVRRQEYRKALADGFTVEPTDDIEMLNRLHAMTFERQGIVRGVEEERLLLSVSNVALDKGFGELLVCRDKNGNPASVSLFLYDHRYGYYYVGANNPDYRKTGAGTLLVLENIRRCHDKSLAGVDFVGINSPNRGDYKTSFNARPAAYFTVDYVNLGS